MGVSLATDRPRFNIPAKRVETMASVYLVLNKTAW
jgi:hypothetical protein